MMNETETPADHEAFLRLFSRFEGNLVRAIYEDGVAIKDVAVQVGRTPSGLYKALARIRDRLAACVRAKLRDLEI